MFSGSVGSGMVEAGSMELRLNHLGFLSLNTAQVQGTPSLPVEAEDVPVSTGGRVGIGMIGVCIAVSYTHLTLPTTPYV